jgi:hypothetical protein
MPDFHQPRSAGNSKHLSVHTNGCSRLTSAASVSFHLRGTRPCAGADQSKSETGNGWPHTRDGSDGKERKSARRLHTRAAFFACDYDNRRKTAQTNAIQTARKVASFRYCRISRARFGITGTTHRRYRFHRDADSGTASRQRCRRPRTTVEVLGPIELRRGSKHRVGTAACALGPLRGEGLIR